MPFPLPGFTMHQLMYHPPMLKVESLRCRVMSDLVVTCLTLLLLQVTLMDGKSISLTRMSAGPSCWGFASMISSSTLWVMKRPFSCFPPLLTSSLAVHLFPSCPILSLTLLPLSSSRLSLSPPSVLFSSLSLLSLPLISHTILFHSLSPPLQRAELADCPKVHSLTMKEEYEKATKKRDYHFEEEVLEFLRSFVRDNERKIESARKRLDLVEDNPEMEAKVFTSTLLLATYPAVRRRNSLVTYPGSNCIRIIHVHHRDDSYTHISHEYRIILWYLNAAMC